MMKAPLEKKQLPKIRKIKQTLLFGKSQRRESHGGSHHGAKEGQDGTSNVQPWREKFSRATQSTFTLEE